MRDIHLNKFSEQGWFVEVFDIQSTTEMIVNIFGFYFEMDNYQKNLLLNTIDTLLYNLKTKLSFSYIDITYSVCILEKIIFTSIKKVNKKQSFDDNEIINILLISLYIGQTVLYDTPLCCSSWYHIYTKFRFYIYKKLTHYNVLFETKIKTFRHCLISDVLDFLKLIDYDIYCSRGEWNRVARTAYTIDNFTKSKYLGGVIIDLYEENKMVIGDKTESIENTLENKTVNFVIPSRTDNTRCLCVDEPTAFGNKNALFEYYNCINSNIDLKPFDKIERLSYNLSKHYIDKLEKEYVSFETTRSFILLPEFRDVFIDLCIKQTHLQICVNKLITKRYKDEETINKILKVYY